MTHTSHQPNIPDGSSIRPLSNGDLLITLPGATLPYLCVQQNQQVHMAILRQPVDEALARAARAYVAQHRC